MQLLIWSPITRHWSLSNMLPHRLFLLGPRERFFGRDLASIEQLHKRVIHQLHALLFARLDYAGQHVSLGFANNVRDRRRVRESLQRENASRAVSARDQLLADNSAQ